MDKFFRVRSASWATSYLAILACASVTQATAQTSSDTPSGGLADIIVTAQKRAESAQDVPATVTAFSQEAIDTRQIRGLNDLITQVPSLQVANSFGSNSVTIRGISTGLTSGFEDPSVAVHVNGVYQARARALNLAIMDLERIEVLSGPQGTLYGRNATGGVINYILRGATDTMEAEATGRIGNYESYGFQSYISGPISDKVGFRISGLWDNRDKGFVKNLAPGALKKRFNENHVAGIRGILEFRPTETLHVDLEGSFSNTRSSFNPSALAPSSDPARQALLSPQSYRPQEVYADYPSKNNSKEYAASVTVAWDLTDNVQLKSISAYQKLKNDMFLDGDSSAFVAQTVLFSLRSRTYTQEVNLNANLFDGRLKSVFGIFYFNDEASSRAEIYSNFRPAGSPPLIVSGQLKARSLAFLTDHTFSLTDRLRLIGGIRYNEDKKTTAQCGGVIDQKFTAWTPRAGVQFDVADKVMAYATYQKGFKAGGVAASTCGDDYDPETIKGVEVGIKSSFANGRIRLNVAGYWYDYGNLQVQKNLQNVGGFTVLNAAQSKIKGIEASLNAIIAPGLTFDATGMVQSAKYTDFINCNQSIALPVGVACGTSDPRPATDPARNEQLKGNWLNRAAPYSVSLGLQYAIDLSGGELLLRGESYWTGKIHYNEFNTSIVTQKAYDLQNIFISYTPDSNKFTLRGFVKNIANVDYFSTAYYTGGTSQFTAAWSPPRTYGVEATYRF